MNSTRWIVGCFLLALAGLLVGAGGCGERRTRTSCFSEPPPILLHVSVSVEGEQTLVEVEARNVSDQALYVCETPTMDEPEKRKGPYTFYGGYHTLVLYWASTEHSRHTSCAKHPEGAYVRRVEPGASITLQAQFASEFKGEWPWSETIYCDHNALFDFETDRSADLAYRVDHVLVIVSYWEEASLPRYKDNQYTMCAQLDGTHLLRHDHCVPLAELTPASYQTVVGRRAMRLEPLDPACVTPNDIEMLAQAGPLALPKPLTIRYWGARWPEWKERAGGQSPPVSIKSRDAVLSGQVPAVP